MKLFLDDIRNPPDSSWEVVRSYSEFVEWVQANGLPDQISFDHDLGLEEDQPSRTRDGYDACKWMLENYGIPEAVTVHSKNPVGKKRIEDLVSFYRRMMEKDNG